MANSIGWGQASVNNTNGYGKGAINATNDWGEVYADSASGDTNIGTSTTPSYSNVNSFLFDGIDDYVNVADNSNLSFGNGSTDSPFSISAWIKIGQTTAQGIVTKYGSSSSTREYLFYTTGGKLRLLFIDASNGANNFATGTTNLSTNTWYHVACTYDGRGGSTAYNGITLYINGVAETVTTSGGSYTAMSNTSQNVEIGKYSTNELLGNIDEVAIWNTDQSANITSIYNNGVPNDLTSLSPISWWRMGEEASYTGGQWTLTDQGSGGNDGTSSTLPAPPTQPSTDVPLWNNKSFVFDGIVDYVDCGNGASLQITGALTLSAWVKMSSTSGQSQDCIISKDNGSTQRSYTLWGKTSFSSSPIAYIWNGGANYSVQATTNIEDDQWHYIMLVYVPSTSLSIYIDGTLENTNTTSIPSSINNASQNFNIGQFGNGTFELNGNIDEVAVWNSDQSANASAIGGTIPTDLSTYNPISWWRMGEDATFDGTNWTLPDNGSGGNDGDSVSMPLASRTSDVPT